MGLEATNAPPLLYGGSDFSGDQNHRSASERPAS